jgi:hypothetical protein
MAEEAPKKPQGKCFWSKEWKKSPEESVTATASYNVCSMLVSQSTWRRCGCSIEKSQHATSEQKSTAPKAQRKSVQTPTTTYLYNVQYEVCEWDTNTYKYGQTIGYIRSAQVQTANPICYVSNRIHFNTKNIQIRLLLRRAVVCAWGSVLCVHVFLLATSRQKEKLKCENEVILGVFDCHNLKN